MAPPIIAKLATLYFKPSSILLKLAPYFLIVPIIVFHALSLTGCVSTAPAIPNIYLIKLLDNLHNLSSSDPLQVRIGYFGICGISPNGTVCQSSAGRSAESLAASLFPDLASNNNNNNNSNLTDATTHLLTTALDLQSGNFIAALAGSGFLFALGVACFLLHLRTSRDAAPRRAALLRRLARAGLLGAAALSFAGALASMQTAEALEYASVDLPAMVLGGSARARGAAPPVRIEAGTTLQVLQWLAFGLQVLFGMAVPLMGGSRRGAASAEGWKGGEV
ncbi:hypothetical protein VTJ83DRAFT_1840 [Remersonia thermophila]|uniref:Uncharacterized protein n=1 Tax=Remersonia thermophila TaxID=72144 RepID=A0ABR4DH20_9PEZI